MDEITLKIKYSWYEDTSSSTVLRDDIRRDNHAYLFRVLEDNFPAVITQKIPPEEKTSIHLKRGDQFGTVTTDEPDHMREILSLDSTRLRWVRVKTISGIVKTINPLRYNGGELIGISAWAPMSDLDVLTVEKPGPPVDWEW